MKIYILVKPRVHSDSEEIEIIEKPKAAGYSLPNEKAANLVMDAEGFSDYVAKYGYHFTDKMTELASGKMINKNGVTHMWTPKQIETKLRMYGYNDYGNCTLGDITYLANMAYADFFPDILMDEMACIKYAIAVAHDPDGYDGIVFSRWVADMIGKEVTDIEWNKFI